MIGSTTLVWMMAGWAIMTPQIEETVPLAGVSAATLSTKPAVYRTQVTVNSEGGCSRGWYQSSQTQQVRLTLAAGGTVTLAVETSHDSTSGSHHQATADGPIESRTSQDSSAREVVWQGAVGRGDQGPGKLRIALSLRRERVGRARGPGAELPKETTSTAVDVELTCELDTIALKPPPKTGPKLAQVLSCKVGTETRRVLELAIDGPLQLRTGAPLLRAESGGFMPQQSIVRLDGRP